VALTGRSLVSVAAVMVATTVLAAPAGAHGGGAVLEVLEAAEVAPGTVSLRLGVTFETDGGDATGAIVDVIPTSPGGGEKAAVRLAREPGAATFAATFELDEPGEWTLAVTSSFPPGSTEVPLEVQGTEGGAGDREAAVLPAGTTETAAGEPGTREGGTPEGGAPEGGVIDAPEAGGAEGGSDATNLTVAAVSGILGGGLGLWVSRRRSARKRAAPVD